MMRKLAAVDQLDEADTSRAPQQSGRPASHLQIDESARKDVDDAEIVDAFAVLEALTGSIEAPADWASEHDHYLYGTPKRGKQAK